MSHSPLIEPRGLAREVAAAYCGLAPSTFDARVHDGVLPKPMYPCGRTRVWDRWALDRAMSALSAIEDLSLDRAEEEALRAIENGVRKRALRRRA
jgi:hypothetical protein